MKTRSRTVFLLLAGLLSASQAQDSPFKSFIAAIWPEYDRPGVLVILTGEIANERLPLNLKFPLPEGAEVAMAIGQSDTSSNLSPLPEIRESGRRWIDTRIVKQEFQIEFYYNPFSEGDRREGEYILQLNYPLEEYHVAIQQPLGGENFRFSETGLDSISDDHGLSYMRKHISQLLPAGTPKTFSFSYINRTGRLTVDILQDMLERMPPQNLQSDTPQSGVVNRYSLPTYEPYAILCIVVVLIGVVFWQSEKKQKMSTIDMRENFCPNCGVKIDGTTNFCSNCGNKLA